MKLKLYSEITLNGTYNIYKEGSKLALMRDIPTEELARSIIYQLKQAYDKGARDSKDGLLAYFLGGERGEMRYE